MGDEESNQVLLAIGKMQGTLDGVAGDIKGIKENQTDQYKMIDKNTQSITRLETINSEEEKQAAIERATQPSAEPAVQPSAEPAVDSVAEERIAMRYIKRHGHGAAVGGLSVGGGITVLGLILWALKAFFTGDIGPPPTP